MNLSQEELKDFLNEKYYQFNAPSFIETDPVSIPHLFSKKEDQEIIGFLAATIAWGQRPSILKNSKRLVEWMDHAPHDFILNFEESDLVQFSEFVHRTFNGIDCCYFLQTLQRFYKHENGLETVYANAWNKTHNLQQALSLFKKEFFKDEFPQRTTKHVADPMKGSTAKRINMFLRWMVRKDEFGVDFGIWNFMKPSDLMMPIDVHSGNVSRKLGLLKRKQNDWKAVVELTTNLKQLDQEDPVKYDFALFGLGVFEKF